MNLLYIFVPLVLAGIATTVLLIKGKKISDIFGGGTSSENCDKNGALLYEEMACTPVKGKTDHCPSSYNCDFGQAKNGCLFKGRTYGAAEDIDSNGCNSGCKCTETNNIECAKLDCPEFSEDQNDPNCYSQYTLGQCCPTGKICTNSSKTCKVDGNTYKLGEQFDPQDTCLTCVCHDKFRGKFDKKTCTKKNCDTEIKYSTQIGEQCALAYFKHDSEALCCPSHFICPDGTENIEPVNTDSQNEKECSYGEKKVNLGQYFEKTVDVDGHDKHFKCQCILPPLVTCKEV